MKKILNALYFSALSICVLICLFLTLLWTGFIKYNKSPSMPYGFYIRSFSKDIKPGNIVVFDNPRQDLNSSLRLMKKVERIEDSKVYLISTSDEELYNRTRIKGIRSFDSRYFGMIDVEKLTKVKPLIVWR